MFSKNNVCIRDLNSPIIFGLLCVVGLHLTDPPLTHTDPQPTMAPSASTRALAMAVPFSSSFLSQAQQQQQQQQQPSPPPQPQQLPVFHAYQQPHPHLAALHISGTHTARSQAWALKP